MKDDRVVLHKYNCIKHDHILNLIKVAKDDAATHSKPCVIVLPSIAFVNMLFDEITKIDEYKDISFTTEIPLDAPKRSVILLTTYHLASDSELLNKCCTVYIIHGYLIGTVEHIYSLNRLLMETEINEVKTVIYLIDIPSLKDDESNLVRDFIDRYSVECTTEISSSLPLETNLQCTLGNGIELLDGKLPFLKQLYLSNCPLTDAMLSTVHYNLKAKKRCLIICGSEFEAKDIAERIGNEFCDELMDQELPDSRTALSSGIRNVNGVLSPTGNPFAQKYDGFGITVKKYNPLLVIGSRRSILYSGLRADVIINVIFTEQHPMTFAEKCMLSMLIEDDDSAIITITDDISKAFYNYSYSPKIFNKAVIHLVGSKKALTVKDIESYFNYFFFNDLDAQSAVNDLVSNGSLIEDNGNLEIQTCKYLNGFFAIEKKKLLGEAYQSFDFKNVLFQFYLANLFFVESNDVSGVSKSAVHKLLSLPQIWKLSDKIGLHDPKLTGSYFIKMESSLILSSICYLYYMNGSDLTLLRTDDLQLFDGHDYMFELLQINHRNLTKTSEICQENYNNIYANVFRQLASICLLFDTSPLQKVTGIDLFLVDSLVTVGIKTIGQLIHYSNLDRHVQFIAKKRGILVKDYAKELRKNAISVELKTIDPETSGNNSRDLFNSSLIGDDTTFTSLCAMDEPSLTTVFKSLSPSKNEVIIIHLDDNDLMKIVCINGNARYYQLRLRCCDECFMENRLEELIKVFTNNNSSVIVSNALFLAKTLSQLAINAEFLLNAKCLSCLFYVVGSNGIDVFTKVDDDIKKSWNVLYKCIVKHDPFNCDVIQLLCLNTLLDLLQHELVIRVKKAINRLINVYSYGIPYSGFNSLLKDYYDKRKLFPDDVQKAAVSKFIPLELHIEMADDLSSLYRFNNKVKKAKIVSTGTATDKQTSLFYTQLSQLRKLNQAIELLNVEYFQFDAGKLFPNITFGGNGRLYTNRPNLQNFAKKLPFPDIKSPRSLITVDDEYELWSADYCEMELRMAAVLSRDELLLEALNSPDAFKLIAVKLKIEEYPRSDVKIIFYGLVYGMGPAALEEYGFEKTRAKSLWKTFNEVFNKLDEYRDFLRQKVINGEILTDYFGKPVFVDPGSAYNAINAVIQSSSAFILLTSVSKIDPDCQIKVLLLIHDEILLMAPKSLHSEVPLIAKSWMETNLDGINFPIKTSYGKSWDNLVKY